MYKYLANRYIIYKDMDGIEQTRSTEAGVPQDSVLGPLLWNITFDKVLRDRTENGYRLPAYADDTLIVAAGKTTEKTRGPQCK